MDTKPDVILGSQDFNNIPQWGRLAMATEERNRVVGLDLNTTLTSVMTGRQGAGKSYAVGSIVEMYTTQIPGINHLPKPGCAMIFHYSQSQDYKPEWTLMDRANSNPKEMEILQKLWGAEPIGAKEVVVVTPPALVEARKREFPTLQVFPLLLHEKEVGVDGYINLMGSAESTSLEMEVLLDIMEELRADLTPKSLLERISEHKFLTQAQKWVLHLKVRKATKFITDGDPIIRLFKPGRIVVVDLRDEFLYRSMAFRLMLCLLNVFQNAVDADGNKFPKILVADEAHEYATDPFLVEALVRLVRLMRHKALNILIASQDPPSLPAKIIELASLVFGLAMETAEWCRYLGECKTQFKRIDPEFFAELRAGECYVWSRVSTDPTFTTMPQRCQIRPRATMHGGFTKAAV